jgi:hypothetical protein
VGLLGSLGVEGNAIIRIAALNAATSTKGPGHGMSTQEAIERARKFELYLNGEEDE